MLAAIFLASSGHAVQVCLPLKGKGNLQVLPACKKKQVVADPGALGLVGPQGPAGPAGVPAADGAPGISAYEILTSTPEVFVDNNGSPSRLSELITFACEAHRTFRTDRQRIPVEHGLEEVEGRHVEPRPSSPPQRWSRPCRTPRRTAPSRTATARPRRRQDVPGEAPRRAARESARRPLVARPAGERRAPSWSRGTAVDACAHGEPERRSALLLRPLAPSRHVASLGRHPSRRNWNAPRTLDTQMRRAACTASRQGVLHTLDDAAGRRASWRGSEAGPRRTANLVSSAFAVDEPRFLSQASSRLDRHLRNTTRETRPAFGPDRLHHRRPAIAWTRPASASRAPSCDIGCSAARPTLQCGRFQGASRLWRSVPRGGRIRELDRQHSPVEAVRGLRRWRAQREAEGGEDGSRSCVASHFGNRSENWKRNPHSGVPLGPSA